MKEQGRILLIDRIGDPSRMFASIPDREIVAGLLKIDTAAKNAMVIDATNVFDFYWSHEKRTWNMVNDIPCAAPPFPQMFVEARIGHHLPKSSLKTVGVLFQFGRIELLDDGTRRCLDFSPGEEDVDMIEACLSESVESSNLSTFWFCRAIVYVEQKDGVYAHIQSVGFCVNGSGRVMLPGACVTSMKGTGYEDEPTTWMINLFMPCLLAIGFMNCKNVKLIAQSPVASLSKAFQRRHGRPLLRYHTLEIEPMKKVLETEGGIGHNGLKKALHICRGHFATYTPDKPLFGRVVGTVWKPAHVRGDSTQGIVAKDYKIKAA